jgi:hypothetical protein
MARHASAALCVSSVGSGGVTSGVKAVKAQDGEHAEKVSHARFLTKTARLPLCLPGAGLVEESLPGLGLLVAVTSVGRLAGVTQM